MKYLLIFLLAAALVRFLNALVHLGRTGGRAVGDARRPRRRGSRGTARSARDIEDAEFEILPPEDPEEPSGDS